LSAPWEAITVHRSRFSPVPELFGLKCDLLANSGEETEDSLPPMAHPRLWDHSSSQNLDLGGGKIHRPTHWYLEISPPWYTSRRPPSGKVQRRKLLSAESGKGFDFSGGKD